uniref:Uncharacterized protein n=1 Tax=Acrobeloides nanus TaxID=290746 RepID=A0A914C3K6_9BILA
MILSGIILVSILGFSYGLLGLPIHVTPAQSIEVQGQLMCNGRPASGVLVKMYDDNTFNLDTFMAKQNTNGNGQYDLRGVSHSITSIDPKINIYHDCNDGITPCQRKLTINIPSNYITRGSTPNQVYNAGSIELANKFKGEARDCIH